MKGEEVSGRLVFPEIVQKEGILEAQSATGGFKLAFRRSENEAPETARLSGAGALAGLIVTPCTLKFVVVSQLERVLQPGLKGLGPGIIGALFQIAFWYFLLAQAAVTVNRDGADPFAHR